MPAVRLSRRRRSSHALFTPARPGTYGVQTSSRPVQFAPNVTPITYTDPEEDDIDALALAVSSGSIDPSAIDSALFDAEGKSSSLFPPLENPAPPPARKRCPPGKRRSQGYIPRPPNAFMLFRADFVKQKHVPGSIETNHGSLSKIIGTCWHNLPDTERRVWQNRAKIEKAKHKLQYPDYRFRPVHNKEKKAAAAAARAEADARSTSVNLIKHKQFADEEDERRCDDISQLLLSGKKGEELALAMQELDRQREIDSASGSAYGHSRSNSRAATPSAINLLPQVQHIPHIVAPQPMFNPSFGAPSWANTSSSNMGYSMQRRPSSVPLPGDFSFTGMQQGIALPSIPQFGFHSRPASPVRISNQNNFAMNSGATPFNNGFSNLPMTSNTSSNVNGNRSLLGMRRPSSAQPILRRSWTMEGFDVFDNTAYMQSYHDSSQLEMMPFDMGMSFSGMMNMPNVDMNSFLHQEDEQHHDEPLPEPETSLFESGFSLGGGPSSSDAGRTVSSSPKVDHAVDPSAPLPPLSMEHMHAASLSPSPLDEVSPLTCASSPAGTPPQPTQSLDPMDPMYGAHGMTQYDHMSGMPMGNGMEMMYNQNMYSTEMNMGYVC